MQPPLPTASRAAPHRSTLHRIINDVHVASSVLALLDRTIDTQRILRQRTGEKTFLRETHLPSRNSISAFTCNFSLNLVATLRKAILQLLSEGSRRRGFHVEFPGATTKAANQGRIGFVLPRGSDAAASLRLRVPASLRLAPNRNRQAVRVSKPGDYECIKRAC